MADQCYITNLTAKIDHMQINNDRTFHYVHKEEDRTIENPAETFSMEAPCSDEQTGSTANNYMDEMNNFLNGFMLAICGLKLTQKATNTIFTLFSEFIGRLHTFNCDSITQHQNDDIVDVLVSTKRFVLNKLHEFDTPYKRQKIIKSSNDDLKS